MSNMPHYSEVYQSGYADKLVTEYEKDDNKVKVKILPKYVLALTEVPRVIRGLVKGVTS